MLTVHIENEDVLSIKLGGGLQFDDYATFKRVIDAVEDFEGKDVQLNLSEIDVTDPAGIGMLLILDDALRRKGLTLKAEGISSMTRRVFGWCPMIMLAQSGELRADDAGTCKSGTCASGTCQTRSGRS